MVGTGGRTAGAIVTRFLVILCFGIYPALVAGPHGKFPCLGAFLGGGNNQPPHPPLLWKGRRAPRATAALAYGHTMGNAPDPVRFQKLSLIRQPKYWGGRPPGNRLCCTLSFWGWVCVLPGFWGVWLSPPRKAAQALQTKPQKTNKKLVVRPGSVPGRPAAAPLSRVFPPLTAVGGFGCSVASLTQSPPHQTSKVPPVAGWPQ